MDRGLRLSFFGLGYVGIVYSVGFASKGFRVVGFDVDEERARLLSSGFCPIYEPHVEKLLRGSLAEGQLRVTADPEEAVSASDVSFITVGTPSRADGSIDLRHVISASEMVGRALRRKDGWHLVAVKSTVIPGTTGGAVRKAVEAASGRSAPRDFGLAVNPEFLREGNAVADFLKPDRIIIGACDSRSREMLESLDSSFNCPKIVTGLSTAELIKYVNNAFLAMKVSFINMIAGLCQRVPGIDVKTVAEAIGQDSRIGSSFLKAGAGWGGSCWRKDLEALKDFAERRGVSLPLVESTLEVNEAQPYVMVELARRLLGELNRRRVAVLGLSFKPNTDDMRDAVSVKIVGRLIDEGAQVVVYDPAAVKNARQVFGKKVEYASSALDCLKAAECALIVTEWDEFKRLASADFIREMKSPAVVDGRRIYDASAFRKGLKFAAVGLCPSDCSNDASGVTADDD